MKKQNLIKKMALASALASGFIGINSIFNEAQAYIYQPKSPSAIECRNWMGQVTGFGATCVNGSAYCTANPCN